MLHHLEQSNLFLIPLDDERQWYRYHHLFAEFLRVRLEATVDKLTQVDLHQRAAAWYAEHHYLSEAIEHALQAQDYELALQLILKLADELWTRGTTTTLKNWLDRLPSTVLSTQPEALMYKAWSLLFSGQMGQRGQALFAEADSLLAAAETTLSARVTDTAILEKLYAMRTAIASVRHDIERTIDYGERALAAQPDQLTLWRSAATISLAFAYRQAGQTDKATTLFAEASRVSRASGNLSGALFAFDNWASLLMEQGRLAEAEQAYQESLQMMIDHQISGLPIAGMTYLGLGQLRLTRNRLAEAAELLITGIQRFKAGGFPVGEAQLLLAQVRWHQGQVQVAESLLTEVEQALQHPDQPPDYVARIREKLTALRVEQQQTPAGTRPQPLPEALSERELEILGLIATGLSNQEIAGQLVVALSTIKWHINNIYGKLAVRTRTQAVARARELGLIN